MSKTDKTKPWWVRMCDHHVPEIHDHRDGTCDIVPISKTDAWWRGENHCSYRYWWYGCCFGCGCWMCTDQDGRKRKARRNRRKGKRDCVEGYLEYLED